MSFKYAYHDSGMVLRYLNNNDRDRACADPLTGFKPIDSATANEFYYKNGCTWAGPFTYDCGALEGITFMHTIC